VAVLPLIVLPRSVTDPPGDSIETAPPSVVSLPEKVESSMRIDPVVANVPSAPPSAEVKFVAITSVIVMSRAVLLLPGIPL
jgi:hypothetical protein